MQGKELTAWSEGYKAGFYTPKVECPYGDDDPLAEDWLDGWGDGKRGRRDYLASSPDADRVRVRSKPKPAAVVEEESDDFGELMAEAEPTEEEVLAAVMAEEAA